MTSMHATSWPYCGDHGATPESYDISVWAPDPPYGMKAVQGAETPSSRTVFVGAYKPNKAPVLVQYRRGWVLNHGDHFHRQHEEGDEP